MPITTKLLLGIVTINAVDGCFEAEPQGWQLVPVDQWDLNIEAGFVDSLMLNSH